MSAKPESGFLKIFLRSYSLLFFGFAIFQVDHLESYSSEQKFWIFSITAFAWLVHIGAYLPIAIYDIVWKTLSRIELALFVAGCGLMLWFCMSL